MWKTHLINLIKKSSLAALLITFGVGILLTVGDPIGPFLFSFGLLCICVMQAELFTGKAGYYWKTQLRDLIIILVINLIVGWLSGFLLGIANPSLIAAALVKMSGWNWSIGYFIKSIFCGMIMYMSVEVYKKGNPLGIIYGIPLFIFCGFQHCIANVIIMGIACSFSSEIILCIIGNLIGSIITNILDK